VSGNKRKLTVDELVSLIIHSDLPTVIVEGDDDIIVYRRIEDMLSDIGISVLQAGGRDPLLKIFEKLDEIPNRDSIAFIADQDTWVFTEIPHRYQSPRIVFTDGYSIENDLYRDKNWRGLLVGAERQRYQDDLDKFLVWYALAVSRKLNEKPVSIDTYPGVVVDDQNNDKVMTALEEGEVYPHELLEKIANDYAKLVRGHSLVGVLGLQTTAKGRQPQINHQVLLEVAASDRGPLLERIYAKIEELFRPISGRPV